MSCLICNDECFCERLKRDESYSTIIRIAIFNKWIPSQPLSTPKKPKYKTYERYKRRFECSEENSGRDLPFSLTLKEFNQIREKSCTYCGIPGPVGIDRIDNNEGYYLWNCIPACARCNLLRGSLSKEKFLDLVKKFALTFKSS